MKKEFITIFILSLINTAVFAWNKIDHNISITCRQKNSTTIDCQYRLLHSNKIPIINARMAGQTLDIINTSSYPFENSKTAILFLIDTSDPGRQRVIDNNIKQIATLSEQLGSQDMAGLASFDKELKIHAPIGSNKTQIHDSLKSLRAKGKTTELYRNVRGAILMLAGFNADRKVIYLFSDGLAEDRGYFHSDVIEAAKEHHIIINSIGFPRSTSLSVALQTIRRLSEETGGRYIESNDNYQLPQAFLNNPFKNIRAGGRFSINLTQFKNNSPLDTNHLLVHFQSDRKDFQIQLPIITPKKELSVATPPVIKKTEAILEELIEQRLQQVTQKGHEESNRFQSSATQMNNAAATQQRMSMIETKNMNKTLSDRMIYIIPLILLIILIITLVLLFITLMKNRNKHNHTGVMQTFRPFAYLIQDDELSRLFPITSTTWRIGRSKDNEMSINDHSISRRHAEIHRSQGDEFNIVDLDSTNGLVVNSEKVKFQVLTDGDSIEIGDLKFRFSLYGPDHQKDEMTSILKTTIPNINAN